MSAKADASEAPDSGCLGNVKLWRANFNLLHIITHHIDVHITRTRAKVFWRIKTMCCAAALILRRRECREYRSCHSVGRFDRSKESSFLRLMGGSVQASVRGRNSGSRSTGGPMQAECHGDIGDISNLSSC